MDVCSKFWDNHIDGWHAGVFVNDLLRHDSYSWDMDKIKSSVLMKLGKSSGGLL